VKKALDLSSGGCGGEDVKKRRKNSWRKKDRGSGLQDLPILIEKKEGGGRGNCLPGKGTTAADSDSGGFRVKRRES